MCADRGPACAGDEHEAKRGVNDPMTRLAGIVLAGGSARHLSGVDKPALRIGGISLLRRAVDVLTRAQPVVVVGPKREGFSDDLWTREDQPGTGPVAALAAGVERLGDEPFDLVVVLAGDLAAITPSTVDRLVATMGTAEGADGAVLTDADGRRQWLIGV
jgi:molybdopterin-guanine dinucleotide biosynthesis protein A